MTSLSTKVEVGAGCDIRDAIQEMCILASRWGCIVHAELNGVTTMAKPGADPRELYKSWEMELKSKRQYKVVCGQPAEIERNESWDMPTVGKGESR